MYRHAALGKLRNSGDIVVHARDDVPALREAGARDQADVTRADYTDLHASKPATTLFPVGTAPAAVQRATLKTDGHHGPHGVESRATPPLPRRWITVRKRH